MSQARRVSAVVTACAIALGLLGDMPAGQATGAAPPSAFVTTSGKRFIDPDGRPLPLKCINLGHWLVPEGYILNFERAKSPSAIYDLTERLVGDAASISFWSTFRDRYITEADIRLIKSLGFNTVRVPFHYEMFVTDGDPPALSGIGYELLDRIVRWSREAGLYIVLDMHAAPGGQTGINHDDSVGFPLLFYVPAHQDLTVRIWRAIAERYKDETSVLGYDLLNEPIAPYYDTHYLNPRLEPLYRRLVSAIREVDRNHVIFLAGAQWSTRFGVFGPPFDDNVAYTYHKFWAAPIRFEIQEYLNFSNLYDVPLLLGESGEASVEWIRSFRRLHDTHGIGWCFWTYKNMGSDASVVVVPKPKEWGTLLEFANSPMPRPGSAAAADPSTEILVRALDGYLENIKLENSTINSAYVEALGLSPPKLATIPRDP